MGPRAGLRSPAPDPKPRGAAWKWGITHAGHARSPKSTAPPSPWDLMQVNPPPPRDQRASTAIAPRTPTSTAARRGPRQAPPSRDDASAPDPAKLDAERPQARAYERDRIYDGDLLGGRFRKGPAFAPAAQPWLVGGSANRIRQRTCEDDHLALGLPGAHDPPAGAELRDGGDREMPAGTETLVGAGVGCGRELARDDDVPVAAATKRGGRLDGPPVGDPATLELVILCGLGGREGHHRACLADALD